MNTRYYKSKLYKELAIVSKSLSNPHRLEILDLIAQGAFSVEYSARHTMQPIANTSQHLQVLKKSGLVKTVRNGKFIHYEIKNREVFHLLVSLRRLALANNSNINALLEEYRGENGNQFLISWDDYLEKVSKQKVLLIDVRPEEEYEAGHIPGARSFPYYNLRNMLECLPKDIDIVAYCRGAFCLTADEVTKSLRAHGFKAYILENGFADWMEKGLTS